MNIHDKLIVITGASSGLGRHFALTLSAAGAKVALCARRMPLLQELQAEILAGGGRATAVPLDVTDEASVERVYAAVRDSLGEPDVLINNSGVTVGKTWLDQSEADWDAVLDTNLKGAFLMSKAFAGQWKSAGRPGAIVNIASILGLRQAGGVGPYAVSKTALIQLTKTMALEFARYGIRINAIAPGYIETDINRGFLDSAPGQAMLKRIPQRRLGRAEDLDGALRLLVSDASTYITGIVIPVDGGHLLSTL
jgi:NAD(P)-dependent dehydrogenase (short-subunit alcohol dehydrogenase family)